MARNLAEWFRAPTRQSHFRRQDYACVVVSLPIYEAGRVLRVQHERLKDPAHNSDEGVSMDDLDGQPVFSLD